jgi:hypothetical protein
MGGLQEIGAGQPKVALPADDLLSKKSLTFADQKSLTFADPGKIVNDQELGLADKLSLLGSWASEPSREAAFTFSPSHARRGGKPIARRPKLRPEDDDEPPPPTAGARIPPARKTLLAGNGGSFTAAGPLAWPAVSTTSSSREISGWRTIRGWKQEPVLDARSMASIRTNLRWKRVA